MPKTLRQYLEQANGAVVTMEYAMEKLAESLDERGESKAAEHVRELQDLIGITRTQWAQDVGLIIDDEEETLLQMFANLLSKRIAGDLEIKQGKRGPTLTVCLLSAGMIKRQAMVMECPHKAGSLHVEVEYTKGFGWHHEQGACTTIRAALDWFVEEVEAAPKYYQIIKNKP